MLRTRSQQLAAAVYEKVEARRPDGAHPLGKEEREEYLRLARQLPILVRQTGLVQTLAFALSRDKEKNDASSNTKKKTGKEFLIDDLAVVLKYADATALHTATHKTSLAQHMLMTRRILIVLDWLKRYAEILLK